MIGSALLPTAPVAVIGAGTMGAGIAQVAATAGHRVFLYDAQGGAAEQGKAGVAKALKKRVDTGKMTPEALEALLARIQPVSSLAELAPAKLVIEAIVEKLEVKRSVFAEVEGIVAEDAILASNTSSLSLTAIAAPLQRPAQVAGLHFFNPAPLMALVEIVSGLATAPAVAETLYATAKAWGKEPVQTKSTPGFIVNRVARPFYAEALRVLQEGGADVATLDAVLREGAGFRMGPFALMDLIGHDVNYAVTSSVFDAYYKDKRFQPSLIQQDLVEAGWLGRKSGRGFYDYGEGAEPPQPATAAPCPAPSVLTLRGEVSLRPLLEKQGVAFAQEAGDGSILADGVLLVPSDGRPATQRAAEEGIDSLVVYDLIAPETASRIALAKADQAPDSALATACGVMQAAGLAVSVLDDVPGLIATRTVAMLANEAADAVLHGVASAADIDTAMTKGVNYPKGPLAWAEDIGLERVLEVLDTLFDIYREDRYRASPLLQRKVWGGTRFHD